MTSLSSLRFAELLDQIGAKTPAPGGGAVACASGALAASLAHMVVAYSLGKKWLAAHQDALALDGEIVERAEIGHGAILPGNRLVGIVLRASFARESADVPQPARKCNATDDAVLRPAYDSRRRKREHA